MKKPDLFDRLDVFDTLENDEPKPGKIELSVIDPKKEAKLDIFDLLDVAKRFKNYIAPPKVDVALSDDIRDLVKAEISSLIKEKVAEAVKGIKPRTIETKTIERVIEKKIPGPEKIIIKEKVDEGKLKKTIDSEIKKALAETEPLFIPAPPIIPSTSGQSGKVLSNQDGQLKWIAAGSVSGSSDAYTLSNVTKRYTMNADDTSLDELADIVGSLIQSLQGVGIVQ